MAEPAWLKNVVICNENVNFREAGDVTVFRTIAGACRDLEPWWVSAGEGLLLNGEGDRLVLGVANGAVVFDRLVPFDGGLHLVKDWLSVATRNVFEAKKSRAQSSAASLSGPELQKDLPQSIEGMIAYIGFED